MMKLFAVRDVKADSFGNPFTIATVGLAVRSFTDACKQDSDLRRYPEDYMLYEIGSYDPFTGMVTALQVPKMVASAAGVIADSNKPVVHTPTVVEEVA